MRMALPLLALLIACDSSSSGGKEDDGSANPFDTGSSDGDGGGGGDGGGTTPGGGIDVECDTTVTPDDYDDGCVTADIACDESLISTNEGGSTLLSGAQYASFWACAVVGSESYTGAERMYAFEHPGDGWAEITLSSPCSNLDLFAIFWEDTSSCPRDGVAVSECEGDIDSGGGTVRIWNNEPRRYLIVVDGPSGEEDVFGLSVSCEHAG